eukprot:632454_1
MIRYIITDCCPREKVCPVHSNGPCVHCTCCKCTQRKCPAAASQNPKIIKSETDKDRDYRVITLQNGIKACLVSQKDADKSAACLNVHVGSLSDAREKFGNAHFLEHMLFLGSEKYPDQGYYHNFLGAHGGSSNAYTAEFHARITTTATSISIRILLSF